MRPPGPAWYCDTRESFLVDTPERIADALAGRAARENLEILEQQEAEWQLSVRMLQNHLAARLPVIRRALSSSIGSHIRHVVLEYDFRRRGLRMDCLLLAEGALFVIEFKRTRIGKSDRDQVMTYAMNLLEFHQSTRRWTEDHRAIVVPMLVLTEGKSHSAPTWPGFGEQRSHSLVTQPIACDRDSFETGLALALEQRRSDVSINADEWLESVFEPSSSIVDAALSLYGNHDVAAIREHAAPQAKIKAATEEIRNSIVRAMASGDRHIIFLSGAPGSGKTLVGLDIVMRGAFAAQSVFVTGNAPLVEVLNQALRTSYRASSRNSSTVTVFGYAKRDASLIADAATFKIVKAHDFLGKRGSSHRQKDSRVLVFDEAQRTYEQGRRVLGSALESHEAELILRAQGNAFPEGGIVILALVGHNQAINRGERGMIAWLEAAEKEGWSFSIADESLEAIESVDLRKWSNHPKRRRMTHGHLSESMRYYRNAAIERWVGAVLDNQPKYAALVAVELRSNEHTVRLTRDLAVARHWAKAQAMGVERAGLVASGQGRRLAAEGLFVDLKPDIATWMLAPSTDVRSSNSLETVQNQFQVQGLELDYCIVCWDADLRRESDEWRAYKMSGDHWAKDNSLQVALNSYRVLLTRARKSLLVFVPRGDLTGKDATRRSAYYDGIAQYLRECGAEDLE